MVEHSKINPYEEQEIDELINDFSNEEIMAAITADDADAKAHAPYAKSHKQVANLRKDNPESRRYYKAALKVINSWGSRRKHGIAPVRESLQIFNVICQEAHVPGVDEGWLKDTFHTTTDYVTYRRKLNRKKEKGAAIISLRALK